MDDDPLAPPEGYGARPGPRTAPQPAEGGDFSRCGTSGCNRPSGWVISLGCPVGEHVGKFGYCVICWARARELPIWCGHCRDKGVTSRMRVLEEARRSSPGGIADRAAREAGEAWYQRAQEALDRLRLRGYERGDTGDRG